MKKLSHYTDKLLFKAFSHLLKKHKVDFYFKDPMGVLSRREPTDYFQYIFTTGNSCDAVPMMEKIDARISGIKTAFDIGANIGITSVWMANNAEKVYAFEPEPNNFRRLLETIGVNHKPNIITEQVAVSDKEGEAELNILEGYGHHSLGDVKTSKQIDKISTKTITLDNYCKIKGVEQIDFLKIDVEGFEYEVLKGASKLLKNKKIALMVFEVSAVPLKNIGKSASQIFDLLTSFDYEIFDLDFNKLTASDLAKIYHADLVAKPS